MHPVVQASEKEVTEVGLKELAKPALSACV